MTEVLDGLMSAVMDGHAVRFPVEALDWAKGFAASYRARGSVSFVPEYAALAGVCDAPEGSEAVLVVVGRSTAVRAVRWEEEGIGGLFADEAAPIRVREETVDLGEERVYVFDRDVPDRLKAYLWRIPE